MNSGEERRDEITNSVDMVSGDVRPRSSGGVGVGNQNLTPGYQQIGLVSAVVPVILLQSVQSRGSVITPTTTGTIPTTSTAFYDINVTQVQRRQSKPTRTFENTFLMNTFGEDNSVLRPEKKEHYRPSAEPTLDLLREGFAVYTIGEQIRKKGKGDIMKIFCCKLPKTKNFQFYKKVNVIDRPDGDYECVPVETVSRQELTIYNTFSLINRYIRCFATLAEFSYEFSVCEPNLSSGLSNVLVVEKVWNYSDEKCVYVPSYKPIENDTYTEYVMRSMKSFYLCDNVEFISTPHTSLFSNDVILKRISCSMQKHPSKTTTKPPSKPVTRSQERKTAETAVRLSEREEELEVGPPKKRKRFLASQPAESGPSTSGDAPSTSVRPERLFTNPTLIVFRQNFFKRSQTLVCPVFIEIHLSKHICFD